MKRYLLILLLLATPLQAADLRQAYQQAEQERQASVAEAKASRERIRQDRSELKKVVAALQKSVAALNDQSKKLEREYAGLSQRRAELEPERKRVERDLNTLAGNVRVVARDLKGLPGIDVEMIEKVGADGRLPGMEDLRLLSDQLFFLIERNSEVSMQSGSYLNRDGKFVEAEILSVGPFLRAYKSADGVGLLNYAENAVLSADEPGYVRRNLKSYFSGKSDAIWIDPSSGGALRQLVNRPTLKKQIMKGGAIVWPIMLLGLVALILAIERTISLRKLHQDTDSLMDSINDYAGHNDWQACDDLLNGSKDGPVTRILKNGLGHRHTDRETLENVLQESILRELPSLERFLPTINILGAIAPLLGLLGTVSGMISTFHVITLYGTGDPRIMSGGISEALITTELGLAMAIPIMLMHTFLSRSVDHIVGDMEEKAVALTNTISKCGDCA